MARRIGSSRRKTRLKLKKDLRSKGKLWIGRFLQKLNVGEKVMLLANSSIQNGVYFRRFHGVIGEIKGRRGFCYEVTINDKGKQKTLVVHPVHLKRVVKND